MSVETTKQIRCNHCRQERDFRDYLSASGNRFFKMCVTCRQRETNYKQNRQGTEETRIAGRRTNHLPMIRQVRNIEQIEAAFIKRRDDYAEAILSILGNDKLTIREIHGRLQDVQRDLTCDALEMLIGRGKVATDGNMPSRYWKEERALRQLDMRPFNGGISGKGSSVDLGLN